jgi:hypothetical protein
VREPRKQRLARQSGKNAPDLTPGAQKNRTACEAKDAGEKIFVLGQKKFRGCPESVSTARTCRAEVADTFTASPASFVIGKNLIGPESVCPARASGAG